MANAQNYKGFFFEESETHFKKLDNGELFWRIFFKRMTRKLENKRSHSFIPWGWSGGLYNASESEKMDTCGVLYNYHPIHFCNSRFICTTTFRTSTALMYTVNSFVIFSGNCLCSTWKTTFDNNSLSKSIKYISNRQSSITDLTLYLLNNNF